MNAMTNGQLVQFKEEIKEHLEEVVKQTVNGKIDAIQKRLDDYIKADEAWKVRAEPVVKAFENTNWLFKLFVGLLKVIAAVGAAGTAFFFIKEKFKI